MRLLRAQSDVPLEDPIPADEPRIEAITCRFFATAERDVDGFTFGHHGLSGRLVGATIGERDLRDSARRSCFRRAE
jgi:hypothetical protein